MAHFPPRPIAYVLVSANHGTMIVNRNDFSINMQNQSGYGVGFEILQNSVFSPNLLDLTFNLLQMRRKYFGDGILAIDCGANIGVFTIEWARLMRGWGEIIAFEAQERVFYALAGNIAINNCFNARALWAAVGTKSGTIGVPVPDYLTPSSFGSLEIRKTDNTEFIGQAIDYSTEKLQQTRMMPLDELNLPRLDFIKIDIEGMEMEALTGAQETLKRTRPQLVIEKIKSDEAALRQFLSGIDYRIFVIGSELLAVHQEDPTLTDLMVALGMPQ